MTIDDVPVGGRVLIDTTGPLVSGEVVAHEPGSYTAVRTLDGGRVADIFPPGEVLVWHRSWLRAPK